MGRFHSSFRPGFICLVLLGCVAQTQEASLEGCNSSSEMVMMIVGLLALLGSIVIAFLTLRGKGATRGWRNAGEQAAVNETRLRGALAVAKAGAFQYDLAHDRLVTDERSLEIFGKSEDGAGTLEGWLSVINSTDRKRVEALTGEGPNWEATSWNIGLSVWTGRRGMWQPLPMSR
jgi:hypothetical protein